MKTRTGVILAERRAARRRGGGIGHHGLMAVLEEGEVGQGVADVGEGVGIAKLVAEGCQLIVSSEVHGAIGGDNSGEETEVVGDSLGENRIGGCGEIDGAASGVLLFKILKNLAVIGEMGNVEGDGGGEVALECGLALEKPTGEFEQAGGMMAGQGQG